jgi:hypothetical protein
MEALPPTPQFLQLPVAEPPILGFGINFVSSFRLDGTDQLFETVRERGKLSSHSLRSLSESRLHEYLDFSSTQRFILMIIFQTLQISVVL